MSDATNAKPTQAYSSERIAYIIGWLHGFEPMVWALVGDKLADETAGEYSRLVYELAAHLGVKREVDE
jgi:hypothetical protein